FTEKIEHGQNKVRLEIADQGCGISPENLDKIFDPYFSTKQGGTGLGLSIVKRIIEDHDGYLEVTSQEGLGTKVAIYL
ncbi:MAG: ATP-binding protein, partial [candidate division KSB1 bacterium]|nr:ATP-binding protein [candidate division KSB1 bacterium]